MTDLTPEALADLRRTFNDDALERLARSDMAYYSTHGHYVPALARLLLAEKAEAQAALDAERARADELREMLDSAIENGADNVERLHARNRNLEAVAEAARPFLRGSGADREGRAHTWATEGQHVVWLKRGEWEALDAALAVLEEPPA